MLHRPPPEGRGHRDPAAAGAEEDVLAGLGAAPLVDRVVECHDHTGRTGVTPFVHHPMRFFDRLTEKVHHHFDGSQVELREQEQVYVIEGKVGFV